MGNQLMKTIGHFSTVRVAEPLAVAVDGEIEADAAVLPSIAQLIGRDDKRRHGARGLGMDEPEPALHLGYGESSQRPIVHLPDELDVIQRLRRRDPHWNRIDDHRELAFEVDPVRFGLEWNRLGRSEEAVRQTLVHQRFVVRSEEHTSEIQYRENIVWCLWHE